MTQPADAARTHRRGAHGQGQDERVDCRGGTQRWDGSHRVATPGASGRRPVGPADPPSPGEDPDSVAVLLRRLRDAAAAHDRD